MFDWIGDALGWVGDAVGDVGSVISEAVWDVMLQWLFNTIYVTAATLFSMINGMATGIFDLNWVQAFLDLFSYFGWSLFIVGVIVAVFDCALEYQTGRANMQGTSLNVLKGFMAAGLFTQVPVGLYKMSVTLQWIFSLDLMRVFNGTISNDLGAMAEITLKSVTFTSGVTGILTVIVLAYCVLKLFFANIKRGGILLCQIAVGAFYMFSIPRGYAEGFNSWCKQIIALCLTTFLQTSLMFLGLLTWQTNMLLGFGIMLSANEVPRIAQQFGLDTSVKVNMSSVSHTVGTAVRAGQAIAKKLA